MVYCAVQSCKNTSAKLKKHKHGITFHRFPRDPDRRHQWEISVNREKKWVATSCSVVCSEHFNAQDFYLTESGLRRLSINAVPNINISICQTPAPTISRIPIVDIKPTDTEEIIQLKFKVRRLEKIAENRKRRLYLMWQGRKRMRMKLDNMKNIIRHLIRYQQDKQSEGKIRMRKKGFGLPTCHTLTCISIHHLLEDWTVINDELLVDNKITPLVISPLVGVEVRMLPCPCN